MSSSSRYSRRDSSKLFDASEWERGSRDTLTAIARQGIAVRLIRDTPHANYDVTLCLAQVAWNGHASCPPLMRASALSSDIYEAEVRGAADLANVKIIDMSDAICGKDICETEKGNLIVYQDGDHLTSSYAESLATALQTQLLQ